MDELIQKYSEQLQKIYDDRIAGDNTFSGVLSEFLLDVVTSCKVMDEMDRKHKFFQVGSECSH